MTRTLLYAKIHRATVTDANLNYEGSLTLDPELMDAVGMLPHEMVHILDVDNGERFQTYLLKGKPGAGEVVLNGAAARKVCIGDKILILSYAQMSEEEARGHKPRVVLVDELNRVAKRLD